MDSLNIAPDMFQQLVLRPLVGLDTRWQVISTRHVVSACRLDTVYPMVFSHDQRAAGTGTVLDCLLDFAPERCVNPVATPESADDQVIGSPRYARLADCPERRDHTLTV